MTLLLFLLACSDKDATDSGFPDADADTDADADSDTDSDADADSDADSDADTDADTDADADTDPQGLPDLTEDLDTTWCDTAEGKEDWPGATSYYVGSYEKGGDGWEKWLLHGTSEWNSGLHCQVVWTVKTSVGTTGACNSCDYGLTVEAELDTTNTDCPSGLYDTEGWTDSYDVRENDDSTSNFFFAGSGTEFGSGYWDATHVNWITDRSCVWF